MFCNKCGKEIPEGAVACPFCGASQSPQADYPASAGTGEAIPNHLVGAILTTLCCCLPFGIVAIVYASSVNGKIASGDIEGAKAASKNANMWMWIAFGCGLVAGVISMLLQVLGALLQAGGSY